MVFPPAGTHRQPERGHPADPPIPTADPQANARAEGKSGEENGTAVLLLHPVERRAQVIPLPVSVVMRSLAQPGAAEIKTQHRQPKALKGFHGVIDHLVVHGSTKERVRVAHHGSVGRILPAKVE